MKAFLLSLTLLASLPAFAINQPVLEYRVKTQDFSTKYYPGHADKIGTDTACAYKVFSYKEDKIIRIEAVGAGMWSELSIPKNRLPLQDGDTFITGTSLSRNVVTYENGVLSQRLLNVKDSMLVNQTVAKVMVDANLRNPKLVSAKDINIDEGRLGNVQITKMFSIDCAF